MFISNWIEVALYLASILVFFAFFMKSIKWLRAIAIASNIAFIVYGFGAWNVPILTLHVALLPLNLIRLHQYLVMSRLIREAAENEPHIEQLLPFMERLQLADGTVIFRQGDPADAMYFLIDGKILFPEFDKTIEGGTIFGEMALFLADRGRTASAICIGACEVCSLSDSRVSELMMRDPVFGMFLTRLIAARMNENVVAAHEHH